ncbi:thiol-disulfide oxidoreductase DCC family protein [Synoicihabitans lomoniglobus]|uniref:DCC1-like thiol-disulfide oxidoreductase family protein n=1 Tax=Synoicihabitans lomoniglobus TaxID=2909285 RepID=A0AAF0A0H2_9BACT|nr:DCC1-like thiol-disulfide oxidoreductase family protein [Opitutaceae bacterium LMO-M01]WED64993.1 DCC1-like thiol-disulfide oxidoreductase family protein [Opitutaceae bacterium LMO-M01]
MSAGPLLLFDGECGLCHAVVRFLLRRDRAERLRFAPLQGVTGQALLQRLGLPTADFDSLVFLPDVAAHVHHLRSDGVVAVSQYLPGGWARVGRLFGVLPTRWRDAGYRLVARSRYALFGQYQPTPLPDPRWAERILD